MKPTTKKNHDLCKPEGSPSRIPRGIAISAHDALLYKIPGFGSVFGPYAAISAGDATPGGVVTGSGQGGLWLQCRPGSDSFGGHRQRHFECQLRFGADLTRAEFSWIAYARFPEKTLDDSGK